MGIEVMIDLETLSVQSHAAILSIGAVKFDPTGTIGVLGDPSDKDYQPFYCNVDMRSSSEAEFHIDGSTVAWWFTQSGQARDALTENPVSIHIALSRLWEWYGPNSLPTWGNGAGFDNVILRNAYQRMDGEAPFKFTHDRCFRTLKALFSDVPYMPSVVAHNALHDAEAQAVHLQKLFNRLNLKG